MLKLRRTGDWYAVWKFFDADGALPVAGTSTSRRPTSAQPDGIDVNDLQLDIVVPAGEPWRWKDVQDLAPSLAAGRITQDELLAVLAAAAEVADLLDRDDRWWAPWDDWTPRGWDNRAVSVPNVLATRYAGADLAEIWSPEHKIVLERQLWVAVLKAQRDLGIDVPDGVVEAYESVIDDRSTSTPSPPASGSPATT